MATRWQTLWQEPEVSPISDRTPKQHTRPPASSAALAWLVCVLAVCLLVARPAPAQIADAVLGGRVVDTDGEGVAGARVFGRRDGTKMRRSTVADAHGFYLFPPLPAGEWDVEASAEGYTIAVVGDVRLDVAQSRRLELALETAAAQEMVTFVDYQPLVRAGVDVGISFDRWELADLPLRSRSVADLATLLPISSAISLPISLPASLPGAPALGVRLDGGVVPDSAPGRLLLPLSAIHQAALLSHSYGVEFGGGGGVVSLLTRSGGAARVGSAFVLYRDEDLEAPTARRHLGASFGGPIRAGRSHFFAAADEVDDHRVDQRTFVVRGDLHDPRSLLRWRYLGSDAERTARVDSLLVGWQTQATTFLVQDFRLQSTVTDGFDLLQLRSDVYAFVSGRARGVHDLAFGVESLSSAVADTWSLYARDRWSVGDRLTLTAALRSEFEESSLAGERPGDERLAPRVGWTWRLSRDGAHLLRGGAGRFHSSDDPSDGEVDQLSLGWSWQLNPFLGLTVDAVTVESQDQMLSEYDAVAVTVRSRFSDVFQVRASVSWTDPSADGGAADSATRDRAVVTGLYQAPADILVAAVYRSEPLPVASADAEDGSAGLDLRLAKRVPVAGEVSLELMAEVFNVFEDSRADHGAGRRMGQLGLRLRF